DLTATGVGSQFDDVACSPRKEHRCLEGRGVLVLRLAIHEAHPGPADPIGFEGATLQPNAPLGGIGRARARGGRDRGWRRVREAVAVTPIEEAQGAECTYDE